VCASTLISEVVSGLATVLAAAVAVLGGIWAFRRQKEYELVQRRYLDEGLDVVVSAAENALNVYSHNWARCTEVLRTFRDLPDARPDDMTSGFLPLPETRFAVTAHYRVNVIAESQVVWNVFQLVIAFAQRGCTTTHDDIAVGLRHLLEQRADEARRAQAVETAFNALTELNEESNRFHLFAQQMNRIARVVEEGNFTFESIKSLRNHEVVTSAIEELERAFADKLHPRGQ
jgi:hypothetical protein